MLLWLDHPKLLGESVTSKSFSNGLYIYIGATVPGFPLAKGLRKKEDVKEATVWYVARDLF